MFKNYIKIAWRNITHNQLQSLLNIAGLSVGMAASFILLLYVYFEVNFDRQNKKLDRIYQVFTNFKNNNEISTGENTPVKVAETLQKDFPSVEASSVVAFQGKRTFGTNSKQIRLETLAASASISRIFSFQFLNGSPQHIPADASSVVLSRSAARKLFGNINAIGQQVRYANNMLLKVAAVLEDLPANSSLQFEALLPWETLIAEQAWRKEDQWYNYGYNTYLLAKENINIATLNKGVQSLLQKYDNNKDNKLFLYPLARVHLYNEFKNGLPGGGRIRIVWIMSVMALGILLIACINFMNMSTARSVKRAKEVGVRKAIGSPKKLLIAQFLSESLLTVVIATMFAVILTIIFLPAFNSLLELKLSIPYNNPLVWFAVTAIMLCTGIIAGSYPAFFLSSFQPVKVLKGNVSRSGKASVTPRQILVVVQFTFAICLIISSIIIYRQVQHIKDRPLGYNSSGLIEFSPEESFYKNFTTFRQEAINANAIIDGTVSGSGINESFGTTWGVTWPGQLQGEEKTMISQMATTYHFVSTMGITLAQGRDFSEAYPSDSTAVILNEAAVKLMRLQQPIGQKIKWQGADRQIVGVVKDFSYNNPFDHSKPLIIGFRKDWVGNITLKLNPQWPVSTSLVKLDQLLKKMNPGEAFDYQFTDKIFAKKFHLEQKLGNLALVFTILSIIISCLGLFGLAAFSAEQRRKEIGIRKVLGASVGNIWLRLSREFVILVGISFVIGAAASSYIMKEWLIKYERHTNVSLPVLMVTLILALSICLLTISWQAIRAAVANPVKSLRSE